MELILMGGKYYEVIKTSEEEMEIGSYGQKWLEFMRTCHTEMVVELTAENRLYEVAKSVDDYAWQLWELLDKQYRKYHPRPTEFEEVLSWERTKSFYIDGAVMRERVLIPHTS